MIQSTFVENRSVFFRVLSDDQIWEIKRAAFEVFENAFEKKTIKRHFRNHGQEMDPESFPWGVQLKKSQMPR